MVHIVDINNFIEKKPCKKCQTENYNYDETGRWIMCEDCKGLICGKCVDSGGKNTKLGPSGEDYCWECIKEHIIEEGKSVCWRCKKVTPFNDTEYCEFCNLYFCDECINNSFSETKVQIYRVEFDKEGNPLKTPVEEEIVNVCEKCAKDNE